MIFSYQIISCFLSYKMQKRIMSEKKVFSTRVDEERIKDLKHLAVDTDRSLGNLLEEAIRDLVKKYEKKGKTN